MLIEFLSLVEALLDLSKELGFILRTLRVRQELKLAVMPLIVVETLDFIVCLDCIAPYE